jgi:hypothetical protein
MTTTGAAGAKGQGPYTLIDADLTWDVAGPDGVVVYRGCLESAKSRCEIANAAFNSAAVGL